MSLIFCDGFDDGLTSLKWTGASWSGVGTSSGRNGSGGLLSSGSAVTPRRQVLSSEEHATFILGAAIRFPSVGIGSDAFLRFCSDAGVTQHVVLQTQAGTLTVDVRRGVNGTILGSFTGLLTNTWQYLEVKTTLSDTVGSVVIRIDGTTVLTLSNVDTKNAGTKTVFDSVIFGGSGSSGPVLNVDDVYLLNGAGTIRNDFLGDLAVETLFPSGNGNSSGFLGSDGNSTDNYQLVDENPPSSTDYVAGTSSGTRDSYAFTDLSRSSGTVLGVIPTSYVARTDTGAIALKQSVRRGTTDYDATAESITASALTYTVAKGVFERDPSTGADFTFAAVNGSEFGMTVA